MYLNAYAKPSRLRFFYEVSFPSRFTSRKLYDPACQSSLLNERNHPDDVSIIEEKRNLNVRVNKDLHSSHLNHLSHQVAQQHSSSTASASV